MGLTVEIIIRGNHNSLGCEQPSGLAVNQSLNAEGTFQPIPGLISCTGVTVLHVMHAYRPQVGMLWFRGVKGAGKSVHNTDRQRGRRSPHIFYDYLYSQALLCYCSYIECVHMYTQ